MTKSEVPSTHAKSEATQKETLESNAVPTEESIKEAVVKVTGTGTEATQKTGNANLEVSKSPEEKPVKEVMVYRWTVEFAGARYIHCRPAWRMYCGIQE